LSAQEIRAKTVLIKRRFIDSWFVSRYGMNLYRGCLHNCAYCDGRAEGYYVEGEFGRDVCVKVNAPEILRRELDPARRRKAVRAAAALLYRGVLRVASLSPGSVVELRTRGFAAPLCTGGAESRERAFPRR